MKAVIVMSEPSNIVEMQAEIDLLRECLTRMASSSHYIFVLLNQAIGAKIDPNVAEIIASWVNELGNLKVELEGRQKGEDVENDNATE